MSPSHLWNFSISDGIVEWAGSAQCSLIVMELNDPLNIMHIPHQAGCFRLGIQDSLFPPLIPPSDPSTTTSPPVNPPQPASPTAFNYLPVWLSLWRYLSTMDQVKLSCFLQDFLQLSLSAPSPSVIPEVAVSESASLMQLKKK